MKALHVALFSVICVSSGCVSTTGRAERTVLGPHSLTEGKVAVINSSATPGMPKDVTLVSVPWDASFGMSAITIKIPGTPYAIPLVGGKVAPVLIKEYPLEVWRIDDMRFAESACESITFANRIEPSDGQLKLILDGGEIHEIWTLNFTDPKNGLLVSYYNGSGW